MKWNENLNLSVFNTITEINESKALTKHISSELNVDLMEENATLSNGGITINFAVSVKNVM